MSSERPHTLRRRILLIVLLPALLLVYSFRDDFFEYGKQLELFAGVYREVNQLYVDDINPGELLETGISGMLRSLDPFTVYYPESRIEDYRMEHVSTEYGGIGGTSFRLGDSIIVYEVYEGYPAQKADLRPGDIITSINGRSLQGMSSEEVDEMMKGQSGSSLRVGILRRGTNAVIDKNLVREDIKVKNVPWYTMINDSTGYIKLDKFLQNCYSEMREAATALKQEPGLKAIVFDLRGNGGGLLEESVNILNLFIEKGTTLVVQKGRTAGSTNTYVARNEALLPDVRIAILTDNHSASASEITAGNFQDLDRGVVVGQRSYGKGLVQQTRPLSYNSQLKVTVARYYTASGRCVQSRIYSERNPDGTVQELPDSLLKSFKTRNNRVVFDGSGVYPDIPIVANDTSPVAAMLVNRNVIFDFATWYRNHHDSIAAPEQFHLSEADYQEFIKFESKYNYNYQTSTEAAFTSLQEVSRREKYYQNLNREIEALEAKIHHNKQDDLRLHRQEISQLLEKEIIRRYYFEKGLMRYSFKNDRVVLRALEVLSDQKLYQSILKGEGNYRIIGGVASSR